MQSETRPALTAASTNLREEELFQKSPFSRRLFRSGNKRRSVKKQNPQVGREAQIPRERHTERCREAEIARARKIDRYVYIQVQAYRQVVDMHVSNPRPRYAAETGERERKIFGKVSRGEDWFFSFSFLGLERERQIRGNYTARERKDVTRPSKRNSAQTCSLFFVLEKRGTCARLKERKKRGSPRKRERKERCLSVWGVAPLLVFSPLCELADFRSPKTRRGLCPSSSSSCAEAPLDWSLAPEWIYFFSLESIFFRRS